MEKEMTAEGKAKELVGMMFKCQVPSVLEYSTNGAVGRAKNSAIIAVQLVIESNVDSFMEVEDYKITWSNLIGGKPFLLSVIDEINKL